LDNNIFKSNLCFLVRIFYASKGIAVRKGLFYTVLFLLLGPSFFTRAQESQFTHFMYNNMGINPGYAGSTEMVGINIIHQNKLMGFEKAPRHDIASIDIPFTLFEKSHGVGLNLINSSMGVNNDIGMQLAYAFQRKMAIGDGKLGIGICGGFNRSTFKAGDLASGTDPLVPTTEATPMVFDFGTGVFYNSEKIHMGISVAHLITGERDYKIAAGDVMPLQRTFYVTAGYNYQLPNPMLMLCPSFLVQTSGNLTAVSFNTNIVYNNRIWGGFSYSAQNSVSAMFGLELLPGVKFGASYDYSVNYLRNGTGGSFEIFANYSFKLKKEKIPQRYKSIRYL